MCNPCQTGHVTSNSFCFRIVTCRYNYMGNHKPVEIPQIKMEKRVAVPPSPPPPQRKIRSLLAYVDLACQSLGATECYFDL